MPVKEKPDTSQTMSFWEHLDVMRGYLLRMAVVILALFLVAFCFKGLLFDVVLAPRDGGFITYRFINRVAASLGLEPMPPFSVELINTGLAGQFVAHMKVAFYAALLCASPFVLYMAFRFVSPALYARERHYALRVMPGAFVMFMVGLLLGYFVIFPLTFRFLGTYHVSGEVSNLISLQSYISTFVMMSLLMGLLFELPVLCWLLARMGLLTAPAMCRYRRHAIVAILILSAVITPTSDAFTLALVAFPVYLLYELSIVIVKRVG